jgi:SAM-dependent methyltransferase
VEPAEYETMFRVEDGHWWYVGLHRLLRTAIERIARGRRLRVLDAGCGTGRLLSMLTGHDARGVELAPEAFPFLARRGLTEVTRGSVAALPFPNAAFDLVVSADVLCCLDGSDEHAALSEFARVLTPSGALLLHLPAIPWAWGEHDRSVHIRRRYRRGDLVALLRGAGFSVERTTYRVTFLFPIAVAVRLVTRIGLSRKRAARSDLRPVRRPINRLLGFVLAAESALIARGVALPIGLSLFAVARKNVSR